MTKLMLLVALLFGSFAPASAPDVMGIGCTSTRSCAPGSGGAFMATSRNSCTAALPVRSRRTGAWYLLTAGHCVARSGRATWRQSGTAVGVGTSWEYGGLGTLGRRGTTDAGVIRYTARQKPAGSRVLVTSRPAYPQRITKVRPARTGERVCVTAGRTGRTRCGAVVAANTSLRYASPGVPARTVRNLAMVRGVCVQPGDSGSPVYAGSAFVGIAVAKAATGCTVWYARADVAFAQLGIKLG